MQGDCLRVEASSKADRVHLVVYPAARTTGNLVYHSEPNPRTLRVIVGCYDADHHEVFDIGHG